MRHYKSPPQRRNFDGPSRIIRDPQQMSNVTSGNVKDWPDELIAHCYQLLGNMCGKEHFPQVWKEK
jgi:hypothetical protein